MLDQFLKAAYETNEKHKDKRAFVEGLKKLPQEELMNLATGRTKLAFGDCSPDGHGPGAWLHQFKGSPLFQQAMELEQASLQAEMEHIQHREQQDQMREGYDKIYLMQDQIRLQKRLLELQLLQSQEPMAVQAAATVDPQAKKPSPEAGAQGAGGLGPEAENSEENMRPTDTAQQGGKVAMYQRLFASGPTKIASVKAWAKELAQADGQKVAGFLGGLAEGAVDGLTSPLLAGLGVVTREPSVIGKGLGAAAVPVGAYLLGHSTGKKKGLAQGRNEPQEIPYEVLDAIAAHRSKMSPHPTEEKVAINLGGLANTARQAWGAIPQDQKTKMLIGAGTGALAGGAAASHDQQGFHPLRAVRGALGGAALGGAAGSVVHHVQNARGYLGLRGGIQQGLQAAGQQAKDLAGGFMGPKV